MTISSFIANSSNLNLLRDLVAGDWKGQSAIRHGSAALARGIRERQYALSMIAVNASPPSAPARATKRGPRVGERAYFLVQGGSTPTRHGQVPRTDHHQEIRQSSALQH